LSFYLLRFLPSQKVHLNEPRDQIRKRGQQIHRLSVPHKPRVDEIEADLIANKEEGNVGFEFTHGDTFFNGRMRTLPSKSLLTG
jgi:hypothetical protein